MLLFANEPPFPPCDITPAAFCHKEPIGLEILLPITLMFGDEDIPIPYCGLLSERLIELFSIETEESPYEKMPPTAPVMLLPEMMKLEPEVEVLEIWIA